MVDFPSPTSAYGRWLLNDVRDAVMGGNWPSPPVPDPYFPYVSMLMPGDGTNGAQNNTFLDSSTNNFTVTRYGNSTQGSFSPYGSNWSNYFNGSSAIYAAYNASLNVGNTTGSGGTVEFFYYATSLTSPRSQLFGVWTETSPGVYAGWTIDLNPSGDVFISNDGGGTTYGYGFTANTWNYCQFVFGNFGSGFVCKGYLNGVLKFTSSTLTHTNNNGAFYIGRRSDGNAPCNGYFSNFRVNTNNNLSTAVPTTPLTAISGTSLLTCQSNRFIDNSSNAFALTTVGSPTVQRFSPLSPTSSYSTTTIGGSAYFDGTGDYLTLADNAALEVGSGDFTIECWVCADNGSGGNQTILGKGWASAYSWTLFLNGGVAAFYGSTNGSSWDIVSGATVGSVKSSEWTHLAISRSGSNLYCFRNGVLSSTTNIGSSVFYNGAGLFSVSASDSGSYIFGGYISDVRLVKGTALYTSAFTPPSAPLTAVSNTQLLMNMTNAGIYDAAMINNAETVGNAQISTAQSKFGSGSMYFNGTSSSLNIYKNLSEFQFGTGNFTVEAWVYKPGQGTNGYDCLIGLGSTANATEGWYFEISTSRGLYFAINNTSVSYATWTNDSTWHHVAATRSNGTLYLFIDGVLKTSGSLTTAVPTTATAARIANYYNGTTNYYFNGYIDDLRVTSGIARYTTNFTPPTTAFPTQ